MKGGHTVLIVGGLYVSDAAYVKGVLNHVHKHYKIKTIIHNFHAGADSIAHLWAKPRNITTHMYSLIRYGYMRGELTLIKTYAEILNIQPINMALVFPLHTCSRNGLELLHHIQTRGNIFCLPVALCVYQAGVTINWYRRDKDGKSWTINSVLG